MHQKPQQRIGYFPAQKHTQPTQQLHQIKSPVKYVRLFRLLIFLLCIVIFCTSFFLLARYLFQLTRSRNASRQLESHYAASSQQMIAPEETLSSYLAPTNAPQDFSPTETFASAPSASELWPSIYPGNPTLLVSPVFYQLQAKNEDIIGWLKIDGLLEDAVLQRDNEYYLTHNALNQKSVTGALFLDESCNLDTVPTQMVIHGHNMKDGSMFGSLKNYKTKKASYYHEHPFIDFNTIYENGRYVIFAVAEVDTRSTQPDYLPFWQHSRFSSVESFQQYIERVRQLSLYRCDVEVQPGDRLLTLSTCTGNDDHKRLVIVARKLRENENEFELNMSILTTGDR